MRVGFLHPDLGIGGAERLVVDAALALRSKGHEVTIYTAHYDASHCFAETRGLDVRVFGDWLPRTLFGGRGHAVCASVRSVYTALAMAAVAGRLDALFVDQISTALPVLRLLFFRSRLVFYCHFPDKLLATGRGASLIKRLYRWPLDLLEEVTTAFATEILVNSAFTATVFHRAFPTLSALRPPPRVLHPAVACPPPAADSGPSSSPAAPHRPLFALSLNRFERKKRVDLAVEALASLPDLRLVVAGGYDVRVAENVEYRAELEALGRARGLGDRLSFECSVSEARRDQLLRNALCLVYTPPEEHFGIVPLEAMALGCPVVAVNSGGPLETVAHGRTGLLVDPEPAAFAAAVGKIHRDPGLAAAMRANGPEHVRGNFSFGRFADRLEAFLAGKAPSGA